MRLFKGEVIILRDITKKFQRLDGLIGHTPLVAIEFEYEGRTCCLYAKTEQYNLSGSVKDRVAYHILREAYFRGLIEPGQRIVEATSGNTGISFAAVGAYLGHPVEIFMPDWMSTERVRLIESYGAEVRLVSKEEGGFEGSIAMAEEEGRKGAFLPRQFENPLNTDAHKRSTGPEIIQQLEKLNKKADAFVAGVGTGGTLMGVSSVLKTVNPDFLCCALDPASSPTLSSGGKRSGEHRIAGIGDDFIPKIVDLEKVDRMYLAGDGDAINMSRKLSRELGLAVGISSGANFIGAVQAIEELGPEACVVTCFADDNKKYLSTDLMYEQPVKDSDLAPKIHLKDLKSYRCD